MPASFVVPVYVFVTPKIVNKDSQAHTINFLRKKALASDYENVDSFSIKPNSELLTDKIITNYPLSSEELEKTKKALSPKEFEGIIWSEPWEYLLACITCTGGNTQAKISLEMPSEKS
ncbi:MAG: hypothetical protein QXK06_04155 [Candidatus Diapherotrites archaeon]